jgi:hypothetical protein
MDVVDKGTSSLKETNMLLDTPLTSLSYHLNGDTRFKKFGPTSV